MAIKKKEHSVFLFHLHHYPQVFPNLYDFYSCRPTEILILELLGFVGNCIYLSFVHVYIISINKRKEGQTTTTCSGRGRSSLKSQLINFGPK